MSSNAADLFARYRRRLLAFIRDRVSGIDDAEDILQDVFMRFVSAERNDSILQASAWLYRAARNRIVDYYRKRREERLPAPVDDTDGDFLREVSSALNDPDGSPETEYLRALVWEELEAALDELPDEQREVFEETELRGRSFRELSERSGTPVNTLLSRKHYAVVALRRRLQAIYEALLDD